ncbi:MAG: tRNA (adenosine(37)-N6)-dimethylallyltransferase MiaA [Novosphingobium sp.]|nr:tRNA (adenosine(37)-N6)-dimethylallyltransferase MiaA [Novosphingobium sp.]
MSTQLSPDVVRAPVDAPGKPPLALIAGPTASGKSDLAVRLALALKGRGREAVVLNADSAQVYADLQVLSARPTRKEMRGVEHRLFGAWDGALACSAADWAAAARAEIGRLHARGAVPILVGGTGLYLRTLLDGIAPVPPIDPEVRRQARQLPTADAYAALEREDRDRAAVLAPNDSTRIARALEVIRSTGRSLGDWQSERIGGIGGEVTLHPAVLLPDRAELYARCDARFARMAAGGAVTEVATLLARGLDPVLPVMRAIGVRELAAYLHGELTLKHAIAQGAQATRNYAKRQFTWFAHQPPGVWPRIATDDFTAEEQFASLLR